MSTSIRTASTAGEEVQIWGDTLSDASPNDGGDLLFVGYRLTVTPADWSVVRDSRGKPDVISEDYQYDKNGARHYKVENFEWWGDQPWPDEQDHPITAERKVVLQAFWSDADRWMPLSVDVTANVKNATGEIRPASGHAELAQPIHVIGAKPRLELSRSADSGNADGMDWISITPILYLFDTVYAGGLKIIDIGRVFEIEGERTHLDTYFQDVCDPSTDTNKGVQEVLNLRCKFHLIDNALRKVLGAGVPLSFRVLPTGVGLGKVQTHFDPMVGKHYRACARKYPSGIPGTQPATVNLRLKGSEIKYADPKPHVLPHGDGADRFTSILSATVVSASGTPVGGDVVKDDLKQLRFPEDNWAVQNSWGFTFSYKPPAEDWRRRIDKGLPEDLGPFENPIMGVDAGGLLHASDVDGEGHVTFGDPPAAFLKYDHSRYFYKAIDGSASDKYLFGQTCTLEVEFRAGDRDDDGSRRWITYPAGTIQIGPVELQKTYTVNVIVKAQSNELIEGATVSFGPTASPEMYTAQTGPDGQATFSNVKVRDGETFVAAAFKRAKMNYGTVGKKAATKIPAITLTSDGQVIDLVLPCSTSWSLSTQFGMTWGNLGPAGLFGAGWYPGSLRNEASGKDCTLWAIGVGIAKGWGWFDALKKLDSAGAVRVPKGLLDQLKALGDAWDPADATDPVHKRAKEILSKIIPSSGAQLYTPEAQWSKFTTTVPVMFEDFNGVGTLIGVEASLFMPGSGFGPAWASFTWVYDWPIWVGSITAGSFGLSIQALELKWFGLKTPGPPPEARYVFEAIE